MEKGGCRLIVDQRMHPRRGPVRLARAHGAPQVGKASSPKEAGYHQAIIRQLLTEKGWDSVYLFPSMTRRHVRLYKIDEGLKLWRGAIPRSEFERDLKQQGIENTDVHKEISAHWLRHSFETIGVSQLGFGEGEVQRTFGKGAGSRRSQYTHGNVMSIVEQSLPVVLKIQAYILNPSLQREKNGDDCEL